MIRVAEGDVQDSKVLPLLLDICDLEHCLLPVWGEEAELAGGSRASQFEDSKERRMIR